MRLGIVGCGLIGQKRAAAAKGHDIVLVADLDASRAQALADKTGAKVAKDWQALVAADLDVDRVTVQSWETGRRPFTAVPLGQAIAV